MGVWFSSIVFSNLAALGVLFALPLLLIPYLRRVQKKQLTVSSVLILKTLPRRPIFRRRLKLPLRFFLELLALLLLAFAASAPGMHRQQEHIAVIVDNSLSMRARVKSGTPGETRFLRAAEALRGWLRRQSDSTTYALFTSAPKFQRLGEERITSAALQAMLGSLAPAFTSDTLPASALDLAQSGSFSRLLIISDHEVTYPAIAPNTAPLPADIQQTLLENIVVGDPLPNAYLVGFRVESSALASENRKLVATVGYSGLEPLELEASFSGAELPLNSSSALRFAAIGQKSFQLAPERTAQVEWPLDLSLRREAVFRVQIASAESGSVLADSISEDNVAFAAENAGNSSAVLLVSPLPPAAAAFGLGTISALQITDLAPQDFARLSAEELKKFTLLVFHQTAPTNMPEVPALFILPPQGNTIFPVKGEFGAPRITSWALSHPLTSYLRLELLAPVRALTFELPAWAQPVVNIESGPLVAAGEQNGVRYAAVGFELLPFEGAKTPAPSVLMLNLLNWLAGSVDLGAGSLTGTVLRLENGKVWQVISPSGSESLRRSSAGEPLWLEFSEPGIWLARETANKDTPGASSKTAARVFSINSFFPQESASMGQTPYQLPRAVERSAAPDKESLPLWPALAWAALALLLVEVLIRSVRSTKQSGEDGY